MIGAQPKGVTTHNGHPKYKPPTIHPKAACLDQLGRRRPTFGQDRAKLGPHQTKFGKCRNEFGRIRPTRCWAPSTGPGRPTLADSAEFSAQAPKCATSRKCDGSSFCMLEACVCVHALSLRMGRRAGSNCLTAPAQQCCRNRAPHLAEFEPNGTSLKNVALNFLQQAPQVSTPALNWLGTH